MGELINEWKGTHNKEEKCIIQYISIYLYALAHILCGSLLFQTDTAENVSPF